MDSSAYKPQISETFQNVRSLSFDEKKKAAFEFDENKINLFLDAILSFKDSLVQKTSKIEALVERVEKITWFNEPDNDSLMLINDLIAVMRDLHSSLLRKYDFLDIVLSKGIANEEIENFKAAIEDLKDVACDLESRFFFLPEIQEFKDTANDFLLI